MVRSMSPLIAHAERVARDVLALAERMKTMDHLCEQRCWSSLMELAKVAEPDTPCERVASDDPSGSGDALDPAATDSTIASAVDDPGSEWTPSDTTVTDPGGDDSGCTDDVSSRGTSKATVPDDVRERRCRICSATETTQWREGPRWVCNPCYAAEARVKKNAGARDPRPADTPSTRPNTRSSTKRKARARDPRPADAPSAKSNTRGSSKRTRTDAAEPLSDRRALAPDEYIVDAIGGCNDDGLYDVSWADSLVDESELHAVRKYWQSQIKEVVQHPGPTRKYVVRWLNTWEPEEHLLGNEIYQAMTRL
jgi:hypothetical protein